MTISAKSVLTADHVDNHPPLRVAEVRAQGDAIAIPPDVEPLGHRALAARLEVSPRTARRRIERLAALQHRPEMLRVVKIPVPTGKGAHRSALHVLWPRPIAI